MVAESAIEIEWQRRMEMRMRRERRDVAAVARSGRDGMLGMLGRVSGLLYFHQYDATTECSRSGNSTPMARPMPLFAPVTTATRGAAMFEAGKRIVMYGGRCQGCFWDLWRLDDLPEIEAGHDSL